MSLPVLIPVGPLDDAKSRLSPTLSPAERVQLTMVTLDTVCHAAGARAVVLTADDEVAATLEGRVRVLREVPDRQGLNGQLEAAIAALLADGTVSDRLLILHADLPLVRDWTIEALEDDDPGPSSVVLARSADGGTNAMLLHPPGRFPLAFGPGSYARHESAARAAGFAVHEAANRELRLDLDTPADLAALLASPRGQQTAAGHYLLKAGVVRRLASPA